MGQALYRKYRSKSLDEIVGQEHIIAALRNAITSGQISHAYLFTGPRGTGKTSIARILAHEVNGLPYTDDTAHIDIIEIDAASNRGIDEIRDLREKVYVAPASGKYKVYIIDEVHMLTPPAFNALLKTLEEPPAHAIFILATTEVHKLPATIISRTQRYSFRPATISQIVTLLRQIASAENVTIGDDALQLIAEHGDGSFRDSVSLFDQIIRSKDKVEVEDVQVLLGRPSIESIMQLVGHITANDIAGTVATLEQLQEQGFQAAAIAKQLSTALRDSLLAEKPLLAPTTLLSLLKALLNVPTSPNPARFLELTLLEHLTPSSQPTQPVEAPKKTTQAATASAPKVIEQPTPKTETKAEPATVKPKPDTIEPPASKEAEKAKTEPKNSADAPQATNKPSGATVIDEANWPQVLAELKTQYNTLYSIIRNAHTAFHDGKVELTFNFDFHRKRVNEAKNRKIVSQVIKKVCGQETELVCLFDKDSKPSAVNVTAPPSVSPAVETVSNIFGGGELLNS
ncbi:MAG TPA: DNA polymerase III subunit gamma/tau [Candidatus Saccharimonadales bacterium]|nr:DNA polymerase III subunit gamma/tau [Candidatus Saccharimonadales bacterium]